LPVSNTPLQREPSSPVAVKRELTRQPGSPTRSRSAYTPTRPSSTPAPPARGSVDIEISPTCKEQTTFSYCHPRLSLLDAFD
jgi:hypothetical protein